jgi:hypothetical protein
MSPLFRICVIVLSVVSLGLVPLLAPAAPPPSEEKGVLERFEIARDGDCLLLPVKFNGTTYQFMLDSGAALNVFDSSLPLGEAINETEARGAEGSVRVKVFAAPEATVGGLNLKTDEPVFAFDFTKIRQVVGYEVHGFIGMPFLRRHVVRLDFDRGELLVLKEPGRDCGRAFSVAAEGRMPYLTINFGGDSKQEFLIDTGWSGSSCLARKLFDTALKQEDLAVRGTTRVESASGTSTIRFGRLKQLAFDEFTLRSLLADEGEANLLGLGFCSRFVITFDLPNSKVYLNKGKNFDRVDTPDRSGLHLLRKDGKVVVDSVDRDSAAETAGVKTGDVLVRVDGTKTDEMSMFRLRRRFCAEDKKLPVTVRRGEKETELILALGHDKSAEK